MAFFDDWLPGIVVGAMAAVVAPAVLKSTRPVTKTIVKTGLILTDRAKEGFAETREQWSDIVAEARAELTQADKEAAATSVEVAETAKAEVTETAKETAKAASTKKSTAAEQST